MNKMKNLAFQALSVVTLFVLLMFTWSCTNSTPKAIPDENVGEVKEVGDVIWHIKAIHPDGQTIDIKALDEDGNIYDVKAIQDTDQRHLLDIKALINGKELPVKILVSNDQYAPVKAIGEGGTIYDIKALTSKGDKLDVKGVNLSGNIIDIKAINKNGDFYGIKAISPEGQLNDVKGIKMSKEKLEAVVNGVEVYANIKALPQVD